MRSSKRDHILDSALRVVAEEGVSAVTFEAVAHASGVTRGGLLYHFPTKDALLLAVHEHLAQRWEAELREALGGDPADATDDEKVAAYARVSVRGVTGPELLLMLEARKHPELSRPWNDVMSRWAPDPAGISADDPDAIARMVAYYAADGLWLGASLGTHVLPGDVRRAAAEYIISALHAN